MNRKGLIAALALVALAGVCGAAIINVPDDQATIQAGINAAGDGDTVLVQPGRYEENLQLSNRDIVLASLYLTTGDEAYTDSTVIDGDRQGSVIQLLNGNDLTVTIKGFTIRNGESSGGGGGIAIEGSSVVVEHCIIRGNRGTDEVGGMGGGISNWGGMLRLSYCVLDSNESESRGGALFVGQGSIIADHCEFSANRTPNTYGHSGGAVYMNLGDEEEAGVAFTNCVFANNISWLGGAMESLGGFALFDGCTIVNNQSADSMGGINLYGGTTLVLRNSILRDNEGYQIGGRYLQPPCTLSVSYSDIEGGENGVIAYDNGAIYWNDGNIDADPLFADPDSGDYRLTAESPCIDAGDPDSTLDPDGTRADMGAFYFHQRDIDVSPTEVHFPAIPWGETDSALVLIKNTGGTSLHINNIAVPLEPLCIWCEPAGVFDPPIEIAPDSALNLWFYYRPDSMLDRVTDVVIESDDPDESPIGIHVDGDVDVVEGDDAALPGSFGISGVYPNPFNSRAVSSYKLQVSSWVKLGLYDLNGRLVQTLFDGRQEAGAHRAVIDGAGLASGVYIARLEAGGKGSVRKIVCVK